MLRHSYRDRTRLTELDKVAAARRAAGKSFRNFGLTDLADEAQIFRGVGSPEFTESCFAKLIRRMSITHVFGDGEATDGSNQNPNIPAGYTYLFQLATHDMTHNSAFPGAIGENSFRAVNRRERQLLLDTIYGAGPLEDEISYELPPAGKEHRMRLRLGQIKPEPLPDQIAKLTGCPYYMRDLPRGLLSELSDAPKVGRPDVLIADTRNDDSPMLAQVTTLFHMAHNGIVDILVSKLKLNDDPENVPEEIRYYQLARHFLAKSYRAILREDLLPRLLDHHVLGLYSANKFGPLADPVPRYGEAQAVSLEFSHAACRLGHAMVRSKYAFNANHQSEGLRNALDTTSAKKFDSFPLKRSWVAQWSNFFEIGENPPQFSRRLGPGYNDILLDAAIFPAEHVTNDVDEDASGLLFRDLVRGTIAGLLKLQTVCDLLHNYKSDNLAHVFDASKRSAFIRQWLSDSDVKFTAEELDFSPTIRL